MENINKFIQKNISGAALSHAVRNEFLQSEGWRKFQEAVGRKTFCISDDKFHTNIIEHQLPIVGKYFYIPRGPIMSRNTQPITHNAILEVINLAKKNNAGWIRIEPASEKILKIISKAELFQNQSSALKIQKAPHDMQPGEILVMDITKPEEELLARMKAKTRYNIKVAQKHEVKILVTHSSQPDLQKYLENFLRLVKITAERDGITPHPEEYYRKMFETIPAENLKLYIAEYEGGVIAANIVIFYSNTATYLHGASDNKFRNVMAPYLLQWQAILDAKKAGFKRYDLGGVKTKESNDLAPTLSVARRGSKGGRGSWQGITRFKTGFSPNTKPVIFSGSYDIVLSPVKYNLYRIIQKIKCLI